MKKHAICLILVIAVLTFSEPLFADVNEVDYYALFMDGKRIGYTTHQRIVSGDKVTTTETAQMELSRAGTPMSMTTSQTSVETIDGKPLSFEIDVIGMKTTGRMNENGMMDITSNMMGIEQKTSVPWPEGALLSEGMRLQQLKEGMKSGTSYTIKVFEPSTQQALEATVTIGEKQNVDLLGRVVKLTEVRTKMSMPMQGEVQTIDYVDDENRMLKSITSIMGISTEFIACEKEYALSKVESFELAGKMFIKAPKNMGNPQKAGSIKYWLSPTEDTHSEETLKVDAVIKLENMPSTDNQIVQILENGSVSVIVEPVASPTGAQLPYKGQDEDILSMLKPSKFIQSDNEKIIELAKQAVGDTKDAAQAAERIESFVADYIDSKDLSVGYASAVEVAESRQGDCSEFAILTAALCRAAGIPSRVAVGYAYVDFFAGMEKIFGGHAWTEVYIGDKWVGLDSAFKGTGRGGYDAGHITLAVGNGDPEDFFSLINTMGQFKIDKLEMNKK